MAVGYGSTTASRAEFTTLTTIGAASRATLVMGWWRPTTLTADRRLWNAASIFGFQIAPTTSRIRHVQDRTTDTITDTNENILVLDQWVFLAFLCSSTNTVNNTSQELFYGYAPWQDQTGGQLTRATWAVNTAGSGNLTGSASFRLGNSGLNSQAWQGQIGPVLLFNSSAPASAVAHPLHLSAFGSWTADEREWLLKNLIDPFYRFGKLPIFHQSATGGTGAAGTTSNVSQWLYFPTSPQFTLIGRNQSASTTLPMTSAQTDLTFSGLIAPCNDVYERGVADLGGHYRIKNGHRR